jgi:hypothetical protein
MIRETSQETTPMSRVVLAVLGLYPALEPAFYTTALAINLFQAAFVLAPLVYSTISPPGTRP